MLRRRSAFRVERLAGEGGFGVHAAGVVHRDLKPGNLSVSVQPAEITVFQQRTRPQTREGIVFTVSGGRDAMKANADDAARAFFQQPTSLARIGAPEDIADVVAFLASRDARWVTGHCSRRRRVHAITLELGPGRRG